MLSSNETEMVMVMQCHEVKSHKLYNNAASLGCTMWCLLTCWKQDITWQNKLQFLTNTKQYCIKINATVFQGGPKRTRTMGPINRSGLKNRHSNFSIGSWFNFTKSLHFEVLKTVVSAAILCLAVHVSDVMNKVGMSGQPFNFLLFTGKQQTTLTAL